MNPEDTGRIVSPQEQLAKVIHCKEEYARNRQALSFEEKLRILTKLQEKAYFMGKTKIKPWPVA